MCSWQQERTKCLQRGAAGVGSCVLEEHYAARLVRPRPWYYWRGRSCSGKACAWQTEDGFRYIGITANTTVTTISAGAVSQFRSVGSFHPA